MADFLTNGIKLSYSETSGGSFTELLGLQEVPELGSEPEKIETTDLKSKNKTYTQGIGDFGDLEYKFKYDNSSASSPYRLMKAAETSQKVLNFKEEYPDGTTFEFPAQVSVKTSGGAYNNVITFTLKCTLTGDMQITNPVGE